jgi:hypothetical protein
MDFVLELLKITIPALIVFLTVFYLMRTYIKGQISLKHIEIQGELQKKDSQSFTLRLQAYERIILMCERLSLEQMLLRLRTKGMSVSDLKTVLILAVNQEFDHNIAQQLYVSVTLWQIVKTSKDQLIELIALTANEQESQDIMTYSNNLLKHISESNPADTAKKAAIKEAQSFF